MSKPILTYVEDLTSTGMPCPHVDAFKPDGKKEFFRVLESNPPTSDSFISHRLKFPDKKYRDECIARSLSISDSAEELINGYYKIPANKNKARIIGSIILKETDGLVKQTGGKSHHSWWRSEAFDITTVTVI